MNDWIDRQQREIAQQLNDAEKRAARESRIAVLAGRFWTDLSSVVREDVDKVNTNEVIRGRVGGTIKFTETSSFGFDVVKDIFPAIYLSVNFKSKLIEIKKLTRELINPDTCVRENNYRTKSKEEVEHLTFFLDAQDNLYLKNEREEVLQPRAVSEYLLLPLLVEPTKVNKQWFSL